MNSDIRLSVSFWDHWKTIVLKEDLGYQAVESLQRLWCFSAINKPTGKLVGMNSRAIEIAARWPGDPGVLIAKLVELAFLDFIDDVYELHDWEEHNGYVVHAPDRSEKAKKAASARWESKNGKSPPPKNATSNATSNAQSNAPSPAPSPAPDPSPKDTSTDVDVRPNDDSSNARRVLVECSTKARDGREGKGREGSTEKRNTSPVGDVRPLAVASEPTAPPALRSVKPPCPYEAIRDLYHETLPELRQCRSLTETRKGYLRQRWNDWPGPDLDRWRKYFSYIRESDFLMGRKGGSDGRPPFDCDLEWLTRPNNTAKIREGKYHEVRAHG